MFVNFNKIFKNKPQTQMTIPQPLVDYMNKSLPKGVKYVADESGNCEITSETGSYSLGGFLFEPTEEQKKILGENYTQQDVFDYSYNSQRPIRLTLKKEGYVLLNGVEFPIEKLSFRPIEPIDIKYIENSFWLYPSGFPKAFPIMMGGGKYEREIFISQVPNESVCIKVFESSCDEPLKIQYFINENEKKVTMKLSLNLLKADTVLDLVQATSIYNAFIDGKGSFLGHPFENGVMDVDVKKFDDNSISFWERVLEIERILKVQFYPPQDDVAPKDIYLADQLYQSLVNKIPVRDNQRVNSLSGKWDSENLNWDINEMIGKPMFFKFECTSRIELFGIKKDLPTLVGVVNAMLKEYRINGKKQEVIFADESQEKKRFNSIMFFVSEDELLEFLNGNHQEIIEMFKNAKKPSEYL